MYFPPLKSLEKKVAKAQLNLAINTLIQKGVEPWWARNLIHWRAKRDLTLHAREVVE